MRGFPSKEVVGIVGTATWRVGHDVVDVAVELGRGERLWGGQRVSGSLCGEGLRHGLGAVEVLEQDCIEGFRGDAAVWFSL